MTRFLTIATPGNITAITGSTLVTLPTAGNPTVLATAGAAAGSRPFVLNLPSGDFSNDYALSAPTLDLEAIGGGDSLDLVYSATPEPSTMLLVLAGAMPTLAARKRWRRRPV